MIKYYILMLALKVAKWACIDGDTFDQFETIEGRETMMFWFMSREGD